MIDVQSIHEIEKRNEAKIRSYATVVSGETSGSAEQEASEEWEVKVIEVLDDTSRIRLKCNKDCE